MTKQVLVSGIIGLAALTLGAAPASGTAPSGWSVNWDPASPPSDLVGLAQELERSLVTVICGDQVATAWPTTTSASGTGPTYFDTSHVSMRTCEEEDVEVHHQGRTYIGKNVWVYDNYARFSVDAFFPPLQHCEVRTPVPGQWLAAAGSLSSGLPLMALGTVLTVGSNTMTTSVTLNGGNIGGPIVDNTGRVVAMSGGQPGPGLSSLITTPTIENLCTDDDPAWTVAAVPSVPRNFRLVSAAGGTITLQWDPPLDAGASPIRRYFVLSSPSASDSYCSVEVGPSQAGPIQCTMSNLVVGIPYQISIEAINSFGYSGAAYLSSTYTPTPPVAPSAVVNLRASALKGRIRVTWSAPENASTAGPVTYEYRTRRRAWRPVSQTFAIVPGKRGAPLLVQVRAVSIGGPGPALQVQATPK